MFNRIWDTPDNGYAEKFKHTIEPFLNVQRTSSIDNFDRIMQLDGTDYDRRRHDAATPTALNNRFYAKRRLEAGRAGARRARSSTSSSRRRYYTNDAASQYDPQYHRPASAARAAEQLLADRR